MISRSQIPDTINSQKLLKDFSKEIRHAERYLMSLNPPKPERESKRKKKKPLNKDFVGYDVVDKMSVKSLPSPLKGSTTKFDVVVEEKGEPRPPLKLTLPKPTCYPYGKSKIGTDEKKSGRDNKSNLKRASKAGKQSPTVIRFKLGDNEVVRSTNDKINVGNFTIDQTIETPKELTWKHSSVYDFHDGSNESDYGGFTIDEAPKRKKSTKTGKKTKKDGTSKVNELNETPKNGIEELLKASAYTLGTAAQRLEGSYVSFFLFKDTYISNQKFGSIRLRHLKNLEKNQSY